MADSRFVRWVTEGQLVTAIFIAVLGIWCFTIFGMEAEERPSEMNTVLVGVLGAWVTSVSYGVKKHDERVKDEKSVEREKEFERRINEALEQKRQRDE